MAATYSPTLAATPSPSAATEAAPLALGAGTTPPKNLVTKTSALWAQQGRGRSVCGWVVVVVGVVELRWEVHLG